MQSYDQAFAYVSALTQQDANTAIVDFRCIHDTNKELPAHNYRGTLPQLWETLCNYNNGGYGIFVNINEMDGSGRKELANVSAIRCQAVDLDNLSAEQNYHAAAAWQPAPAFAVQSSHGKFHVYWTTSRHTNSDGFTLLQRKLRALFDGDKSIIDPTRVLRLPGMLHLKNPAQPHLVTCWALAGYGQPINPAVLEQALAHINVQDGSGGRKSLGDTSMQAPGLDWCIRALQDTDPNSLERDEWVSFTAAWKQAAWNFAPEAQLFEMWSQWCERYQGNDTGENLKNWNSIRNTEVGWHNIERRVPSLLPMRLFSEKIQEQKQPLGGDVPAPPQQLPIPDGEFLTDAEQRQVFAGCTFIEKMGSILTPSGRFMNSGQFNGTFGGRKFIIDSAGKVTDEAWKAATRSTLWQVPKADHIRFVPSLAQGVMITDALGRVGVNTYRPAIINSVVGDISPFMRHMELLLPVPTDRQILFDYLAHNIRFPGHKIPWAPLIQSVEGAGKGMIKALMIAGLGMPYSYFPKAQELIDSGSKFNAWMRAKLFILVDEIKVDERRDMIEILKPMISEKQIEIQGKGIDQDMEDNFANWFFFSNYKDAIPINKNSRRFAVFYSAIQNNDDLRVRGMTEQYFNALYNWMENGGASHVVHWLQNYAIERGAVPMRAPITSSHAEAVHQSRGPIEIAVMDAIVDEAAGFRGGWVSSLAVAGRLKGMNVRTVSAKTLGTIMDALGYYHVGRAARPYHQESTGMRADLYNRDRNAQVAGFGFAQGYEV